MHPEAKLHVFFFFFGAYWIIFSMRLPVLGAHWIICSLSSLVLGTHWITGFPGVGCTLDQDFFLNWFLL